MISKAWSVTCIAKQLFYLQFVYQLSCQQVYYNTHKDESSQLQLAMESDFGTFSPLGLAFSGNKNATCIMQEVMKLLEPINATQVEGSHYLSLLTIIIVDLA